MAGTACHQKLASRSRGGCSAEAAPSSTSSCSSAVTSGAARAGLQLQMLQLGHNSRSGLSSRLCAWPSFSSTSMLAPSTRTATAYVDEQRQMRWLKGVSSCVQLGHNHKGASEPQCDDNCGPPSQSLLNPQLAWPQRSACMKVLQLVMYLKRGPLLL